MIVRVTTTFLCAVSVSVAAADAPHVAQGLGIRASDARAILTPTLAGHYAEGDDVVLFEAHRSLEPHPGPAHAQFDADGRAVNVSVRFMDRRGANLVVSLALHVLPPGWTDADPGTVEVFRDRALLFDLVARAGEALASHPFDLALGAERDALVMAARAAGSSPAPDAAIASCSSGSYQQYFEWRNAPCCFPGASHSATRWWNYRCSAGQWYVWSSYATSNHGWSANDPGMKLFCSRWSGVGWSARGVTTCDALGSTYHVCASGNNHNCHDDSRRQRDWVVGGSSNGSYCSAAGCLANPNTCSTGI